MGGRKAAVCQRGEHMFAVSVLSSGSTGNSIYVKAGRTELLFDAGLSRRTIFSHLNTIGASPDDIDALFISHEHSDHVKGIGPVQRALRIPVYATKGTLKGSSVFLGKVDDLRHFTGGLIHLDSVELGNTLITPVRVAHDANDPTGYIIEHKGKRLGIFTDLGRVTSAVKGAFSTVHCAVLEANHCIDMLWNGPYPLYLKERIASPHGHLSNESAALLLIESASPELKSVFLAHRSINNNTPERAHIVLDHARKELKRGGNGHSGRIALVHTSRAGPTGLVAVGKALGKTETKEVQPDLSIEEKLKPLLRKQKGRNASLKNYIS